MSVSDLINTPCTIVRNTAGTRDGLGNPTHSTTERETVCDLQQIPQLGESELSDEHEISKTTWSVFFRASEDIKHHDEVIINGARFEVNGEPWAAAHPITGEASHVEASLVRVAGGGA